MDFSGGDGRVDASGRRIDHGQDAGVAADRVDVMGHRGFVVDAVAGLEPVGVLAVQDFDAPGQDVDELLAFVVVQDDLFDATSSVTVCAFTSDPTDAPLFRIPIDADDTTGIRQPSRLMVDKITTVPRSKLGERVGRLSDDDMTRLGRSIAVFLGLASLFAANHVGIMIFMAAVSAACVAMMLFAKETKLAKKQ